MSRKITFLTLFLWLTAVTFPVIAQQKADTTYTFRFVPREDMFYVPWNGNDTELARLLECIERNRTDILDGRLPLLVDGYCNSLGRTTVWPVIRTPKRSPSSVCTTKEERLVSPSVLHSTTSPDNSVRLPSECPKAKARKRMNRP